MEHTAEEEAYPDGDRSGHPRTDNRRSQHSSQLQLLAAANFSNPIDVNSALMLQSNAAATLAKTLHLLHNMIEVLGTTASNPTTVENQPFGYGVGHEITELQSNFIDLLSTLIPASPECRPRPAINVIENENNISNPSTTLMLGVMKQRQVTLTGGIL
ncbi:hypothetical protein F3Y22_tig00111303pilonHSYRG00096 [Hibiscus syriacus]|uniref:Uncharacterized protein n=1 Tax=Hibiscus syriacus TaxID=106335 RepID=A0A6A2YR72_HIBSY|nr:hypothetical protein F3Y22_tig00111303pilonHSYRG00096 [Hibiscus syriacus]